MILYHHTAEENVPGILEHGLLPRKTTGPKGNYQGGNSYLQDQPRGIYCTRQPGQWYRPVILALDVSDRRKTLPDPIITGAVVLTSRVPPSCIQIYED